MAPIRPSAAVRAVRNLHPRANPVTTSCLLRPFSSTARRPSSHEPSYDPPTGWLFGIKPGEKYQREGWEGPFFYGFCGSIVVFLVAYSFKPDTS